MEWLPVSQLTICIINLDPQKAPKSQNFLTLPLFKVLKGSKGRRHDKLEERCLWHCPIPLLHTCSSPTSVLYAQSYLDMVLCLGLRLCTSSENPGRLEAGSMTSSAWTLIYQAESCWQESMMRTPVAFCELAMSEIQTQPPFQGFKWSPGFT